MSEVVGRTSHWATLVAAVAAFVVGSLWSSPLLFGEQVMRLRGLDPGAATAITMPAGLILAEFVRELVATSVLARLMRLLEIVDWRAAVRLGAWIWLGFPSTLLAGSVMWENVPWQLAAIHAADWLMKLLVMAAILGTWPRRTAERSNA